MKAFNYTKLWIQAILITCPYKRACKTREENHEIIWFCSLYITEKFKWIT